MSSLKAPSEISSISSLPVTRYDIPAIAQAVQHLRTLEKNLLDGRLLPSKDIPGVIKSVIEAILELEAEAGKNHERLEIETMKTSVLRHRLQVITASFEQQKRDDGNLTKTVNTTDLFEIKTRIQNAESHTKACHMKYQEIQANLPLHQTERESYRNIMKQVTQKANMKLIDKSDVLLNLRNDRAFIKYMLAEMSFMDETLVAMYQYLEFERQKCARQVRECRIALKEKKKHLKSEKKVTGDKEQEMLRYKKEKEDGWMHNQEMAQGTIYHNSLTEHLHRQEEYLKGKLPETQDAIASFKQKKLAVSQAIKKAARTFEVKVAAAYAKIMAKAKEKLEVEQKSLKENEEKYENLQAGHKQIVAEVNNLKIAVAALQTRMKDEEYRISKIRDKIVKVKQEIKRDQIEHEVRMIERRSVMRIYEAQRCEDDLTIHKTKQARAMSILKYEEAKRENLRVRKMYKMREEELLKAMEETRQLIGTLNSEEATLETEVLQDEEVLQVTEAAVTEQAEAFEAHKQQVIEEVQHLEETIQQNTRTEEAIAVFEEAKDNFHKIEELHEQVLQECDAVYQKFTECEEYELSLEQKATIMQNSLQDHEECTRSLNELRNEYHEEVIKICCDVSKLENEVFRICKLKGYFDIANDKWKKAMEELEQDYSRVAKRLKFKLVEHGQLDLSMEKLEAELKKGAETIKFINAEVQAQKSKTAQHWEQVEFGAKNALSRASLFHKTLQEQKSHVTSFIDTMMATAREKDTRSKAD